MREKQKRQSACGQSGHRKIKTSAEVFFLAKIKHSLDSLKWMLYVIAYGDNGAGDEIRTRDICLGKATLYH